MRILIVAVGRLRDRALRQVIDDYLGRISHYASCEEKEIRAEGDKDVADRIAKALPERARVVALEVGGKAWSSTELADFLGRCEQDAVGTVAWLIGGAEGLPREAVQRADLRLSLSSLTLPHRLARVLLAEQIYRGFSILRGEPYARE